MISAIRDDNPVVYIFHTGLMGLPWMVQSSQVMDVPTAPYTVPIGKARIARAGALGGD
jgi:pyruvate/2-oxoglutarate/acetoin dehydrogenase E1 component